MKQGKIPNSQGAISVQGHEERVKAFTTAYRYFKQLESQIEDSKKFFREAALVAAAGAMEGVTRVEFYDSDGGCIPVSLPDATKVGSRLNLSDSLLGQLARAGMTMEELERLGVLETEETFTLKGPWVKWFKEKVIGPYLDKGVQLMEGFEHKEVRRLSAIGVDKLKAQQMKAEGEELERLSLLLRSALKAPTVNVK